MTISALPKKSPNGARLSLLILSGCALLAQGCKSRFEKRLLLRPELRISAVAVYPFGFRWDEPTYRSFELSQRLIDAAQRGGGDRFLFFGPSELKVFRQDGENAWAASSVLTLLGPARVRPYDALVLRPWAERRIHSGQNEILDRKGRKVGLSRSEEVTYVGQVELFHPSTHELVVQLTGETKVDPFAKRPGDGSDPTPELTSLMEALVLEAIASLIEHTRPPARARSRLGVSWSYNPKVALELSDRPSPLEMAQAELDPLEAELLILGRVRFANPTLSDEEIGRLARLPGGLYIREVDKGSKLEPGDLITEIDGRPALPQALSRLRFSDVPAQVKIMRAGQQKELLFP
jgi:hypothetical protein